MTGMNDIYFNYLADQSAIIFTHVGLVDENGQEFDLNSVYNRQPATFNVAPDGKMTLAEDLTFDIPGSGDALNPKQVTGFRLFDAATGGNNYGGKLLHVIDYVEDGQYIVPMNKVFMSFKNSN
jgi:hypothetical protein